VRTRHRLRIADDLIDIVTSHISSPQPTGAADCRLARTIDFSLERWRDGSQVLLSANIGILVRGEIGVETAISSGGFVFIGTDDAGDDPLKWQFYCLGVFPTMQKLMTLHVHK
jgi:hypothetical protein